MNELIEKLKQCQDQVVLDTINELLDRSQKGVKKYGTTLADNPLSKDEWLQHLKEELMDAIQYINALKTDKSLYSVILENE